MSFFEDFSEGDGGAVSPEDWFKGIALSVLASFIGCASKLSIRKSWLIEAKLDSEQHHHHNATAATTADGNNRGSSSDDMMNDGTIAATSDADVTALLSEESSSLNSSLLRDPLTNQTSSHNETSDSSCEGEAEEDDRDALSTEDRQLPEQQAADNDELQRRRYIRRKGILAYVLRGSGMFGMSVLNPLCCVLAMNYASPSILAPFSGLTLVWVIIFSYPALNEIPSRQQIIAAILIVIGEVIVALFGDHTNDSGVTIEEVRESYYDPLFLSYFGILSAFLLLEYYWIRHSESPRLCKFAWGTCGGSLTGLQNFLKDALTLLKAKHAATENGVEDFHLPWFYALFIVLAGATAFIGLLWLTACMKRYDAAYSSATFVGSFVVSASIMSAVHYKTFEMLHNTLNYVLYPVGLIILMIGVFVLVHEQNVHDNDQTDGGHALAANISEEQVRVIGKDSIPSESPFFYVEVESDQDPYQKQQQEQESHEI